MAPCIMALNMLKLGGGGKRRGVVPVQMAHPGVEMGEAGSDVTEIAFEVLDIDGVEADESGEEAYVCLGGGGGGEQVGCLGGGEVGFEASEGGEEGGYSGGVGFLSTVWGGGV